jgi:hypothetical protein
MKVFFLISALIMTPLSFGSYHGEGNSGNNNNSGGGYGGSDALAIAGVIALVGGLAYYFTRDAKDEDEANALIGQNSYKPKKFEIDFNNNLNDKFNSFHTNSLEEPQNHLQINIKYKLN